jgi:hypothetical protein
MYKNVTASALVTTFGLYSTIHYLRVEIFNYCNIDSTLHWSLPPLLLVHFFQLILATVILTSLLVRFLQLNMATVILTPSS